MKEFVLFIIIFFLIFFIYIRVRKNFKFINAPSICLITGGIKTGKSMLCCNMSHKDYFRLHRKWWIRKHILLKEEEEPLFYTNVYNNFGFWHKKLNKNIKIIDTQHLLREIRFNYKSVVFIDEVSLLADNMDFNDKERNVDLSLYHKLFAHSTKGGRCYLSTQSIMDSHYSIKRVSSTFFFIQKQTNWLLFHILYVRELVNTEIGVNDFDDDVDTTTRKVIIPFWWHSHYDRYYFSYLTDKLPKKNENNRLFGKLVSFNPLYIERADKRPKKIEQHPVVNPTITDTYKGSDENV